MTSTAWPNLRPAEAERAAWRQNVLAALATSPPLSDTAALVVDALAAAPQEVGRSPMGTLFAHQLAVHAEEAGLKTVPESERAAALTELKLRGLLPAWCTYPEPTCGEVVR